jgi:hypothetical protein
MSRNLTIRKLFYPEYLTDTTRTSSFEYWFTFSDFLTKGIELGIMNYVKLTIHYVYKDYRDTQ